MYFCDWPWEEDDGAVLRIEIHAAGRKVLKERKQFDWRDRYILGARRGFGIALRALRLAESAHMRRPANWILPAMLTALAMFVSAIFLLGAWDAPGIGMISGRVIFIDWLIFFFGWIGGWNTASKWRRHETFVEELVVTNLPPSVIGNLLFAGSLGIWQKCLMILAAFDLIALTSWMLLSSPVPFNAPGSTFVVYIILYAVCMVPFAIMLAFFHLESLRIAYWMFAISAIPRISLLNKAIVNLVLIAMYVPALTLLGIAVSGGFAMISAGVTALIGYGIIESTNSTSGLGQFLESLGELVIADFYNSNIIFMFAAIPGFLLIGYIKRLISNLYEKAFWKSYLYFTWWGAGERTHPNSYPYEMTRDAIIWIQHFQNEERRIGKMKDIEIDADKPEPPRNPLATDPPAEQPSPPRAGD